MISLELATQIIILLGKTFQRDECSEKPLVKYHLSGQISSREMKTI